jgi:hypothetical protein
MSKKSRRKKGAAFLAAGRTSGVAASSSRGWMVLLKALCIVAAAWWIFAPALHGDWADDDLFYLSGNPLRNDPHQLWKIWLQPGSFIEYYPITETIQIIQWHFWHTDSFGYVLTNIVLHIVNALLRLARRTPLCRPSPHRRIGSLDFRTQEHPFPRAVPSRDVRVDRLRRKWKNTRLPTGAGPVFHRHALQDQHGAVPRDDPPLCLVETGPGRMA